MRNCPIKLNISKKPEQTITPLLQITTGLVCCLLGKGETRVSPQNAAQRIFHYSNRHQTARFKATEEPSPPPPTLPRGS
jgi:hypothetical protein